MKEFLSKYTAQIVLSSLIILIFTSCIETEQFIYHSEGKFHYEYRLSYDEEAITFWYNSFGLDITDMEKTLADSMIEDLSSFLFELEEEFEEVSTTITKVDDYTVDMGISFPEKPRNAKLREATLPIKPLRTLIPLFPLDFIRGEKEKVTDTTNNQKDDLDKILTAMFYDCYWTIAIQDKLLPDDIWVVELCNMELDGKRFDYEYNWGFLTIKIPMAEFIDEANYTHLVIY